VDEDSHEEVEAIVVVVEDFEVCPLHPAVASCALQESGLDIGEICATYRSVTLMLVSDRRRSKSRWRKRWLPTRLWATRRRPR